MKGLDSLKEAKPHWVTDWLSEWVSDAVKTRDAYASKKDSAQTKGVPVCNSIFNENLLSYKGESVGLCQWNKFTWATLL